ncbi:MAG: DUF2141 domain-containing protein [Parvibaculum sp.]|uniref:DUF2141 domain-containing protein n=1 Tax=Parvibaculum sp. TaxID=2024848 RepID=UPI0025F758A9|nr:DUF2141 domain-containing protein [Parvibaculum sp.]MCE9648738.1 DUF2141 domain-containing protein [Parvibaculum sp.]
MRIGKIAVGVLLSAWVAFPARASELELTIVGVRSDEGAVMVGVYDSAEKFRKAIEKAGNAGHLVDADRMFGATLRARAGDERIGIALPPGRYGLIVFHDENDDGRLDTSMLGVPTEGYGFSNNAMGFLSAPTFDSAAVMVGDKDRSIVISLDYPGVAMAGPASR